MGKHTGEILTKREKQYIYTHSTAYYFRASCNGRDLINQIKGSAFGSGIISNDCASDNYLAKVIYRNITIYISATSCWMFLSKKSLNNSAEIIVFLVNALEKYDYASLQ